MSKKSAKSKTSSPANSKVKKSTKKTVESTDNTEKAKVYFAPPSPKINEPPTYPVVYAKCRRGSDRMSEGQFCNNLSAENLTQSGSNVSRFRCTKCKYAWHVQTGGVFQEV